ncbi:TraR/DksA C4-type zinc finger protein [Pseudaeromonas paramecii]|uniref:TraR/DksA family transcriptional regulator n=1 Tax=Pseudaeromonas paramecii TaxID=2138166 RepID=A0ABP8PYB5_9GAMM
MSDDVDQAGDLIALQEDIGIQRVRAQLPAGAGAAECQECGEPIPARRRKAIPGTQVCAECQTILELKAKQRRAWW